MNTRIRFSWLVLLGLLLLSQPAQASFTLTVSTQGSGTVATNPVFPTYPSNVSVTLAATPGMGWYFAGWSGAVSASTNPVNVLMTTNLAVMATFLEYPIYSLALTTNGQGSISLNPAGGIYDSNTVVTATATPAAGWEFIDWSGAANATGGTVTLALDSNLALTGTFVQLPAFDVEPQNITNTVGSTVSFSSHSVGTAPVAYQWYFSNEPISGATNDTLTLADATANAAGFYQVVATNLYGSATSSVVELVLTSHSGSTNVVSVCDEAGLQAAISAGGWVSIGCSGTITLSSTIYITQNVILDGTGVSATIGGGNAVQLFYVEPGASFSLTNLTLANGSSIVTSGNATAAGGAIYNNGGTVTLTACTLTNNGALAEIANGIAHGGAIYNSGGLIGLYGSTLLNNNAMGNDTASQSTSGQGCGGAIFNTNGTVTIANCFLRSNLCNTAGYVEYEGNVQSMGGAVCQASGALVITNCILVANQALGGPSYNDGYPVAATAYGGALAASGGSVRLDQCQLTGNTAHGGNGANGSQAAPAFGGAVYSASTWSAVNCSFSGNQALAGGASYAEAQGSTAPTASGGAICSLGPVVLVNCLVCSNGTQGGTSTIGEPFGAANGGNGVGGGIFNAAQLLATNCTFAQNSALGGQGLVYSYGDLFTTTNGSALGGGIFNSTNASFLGVNVTIASNFCNAQSTEAFDDNGLMAGSQIANTNGSVSLLNSLIAYGGTNGNAYGEITDLGDNISSDGSANFNSGSSYNNTDPLLGALANNGGPTLTMALSPESPAIDYANSADSPPDDQRGYARPTGIGVIDLGAYQYGATQIYIPFPMLSIADAYPNVLVSFTTSPAITNTLHFQSSTNLINWIDLQTIGALASPSNISETISPQGVPRQFFRLWW